MTHPFGEIVVAAVLVVVVGAGTLLVLPRSKPEPSVKPIVIDVETPATLRAEPQRVKSDAERVDDLQRELIAIAAEQKKLAEALRAAADAHATNTGRRKDGRDDLP